MSQTIMLRRRWSFLIFILLIGCCSTVAIASKTYTGKVIPLVTSTLAQGGNGDFNGVINHVARTGQIIKPSIFDSKTGEKIVQGTILVSLESDYFKADIEAAQNNLEATEAQLVVATEQYNRYKSLEKTQSIAQPLYEQMRAAYYDAISAHESAKATLIQANEIFDSYIIEAPFDGIVDKVLLTSGTAAGQPTIITISQLDPIAVQVTMTPEEANAIEVDTPVTVYSFRSNKPLGIYHGYTSLTKGGIIFGLDNYPVNTGFTEYQGKQIPYVNDTFQVMPFWENPSKHLLAVPLSSIFKDDKGSYVVVGKGQKNFQINKGVNSVFHIEKKYIVPGDLKRNVTGYIIIRSLKDPKGLESGDVIVLTPPSGFKDGDLVCFAQERYLFMPGDQVKVVVGN